MKLLDDLKNFARFNGNSKLIVPQHEQKKMEIFMGICVHRTCDPETAKLLELLRQCPDANISVMTLVGDALIARSRSRVATTFLNFENPKSKNKGDILFFIDDDIIFNPREIPKMSKMMLDNNLDILGGAYCTKSHQDCHFVIKPLDDQPLKFGKDGAIQEVRWVSSGFMAIHRRVLEEMIKKDLVHLCHPNDLKYYPFFMGGKDQPSEMFIEGEWICLSEDWIFCERARNLGFKVWVDTTVKLGHAGRYVYDWDDIGKEPKKVRESFNYWDKNGHAYFEDLTEVKK